MTPEEFWSRVNRGSPDECWEWQHYRNLKRGGYGTFRERRKSKYAHRRAYELAVGPIPPGYIICHRCDNPPCCNPAHLFLGKSADNTHDAVAKGRITNGERSHLSRLTEDQVLAIRREWSTLRTKQRVLAQRYGVAQPTINNILTRKHWKHLPEEDELRSNKEAS